MEPVVEEASPADASVAAPDTPTPGAGEGGLLQALLDSKEKAAAETKPALRPDQIANAVSFLTNPKVVDSTSGAKRSFLLNKGLTDEEIDSAVEKAKSVVPAPAPVPSGTPQPEAAPISNVGPSQVPVADTKSIEVRPTPMGDLRASWTRITAAVVLVGFATVGVGTVAMPYLKKGWRWFTGTDTDDIDCSDAKKFTEALDKHTQQQQELFKQVKEVATAVKTLQDNKEQSSVDSRASAQLDALRNDVTALNAAVAKNAPAVQEMSEIKSMLQRHTPGISRQSSGPFRSPPPETVTSRRAPYATYPEPVHSTAADRAAAASRPLFATPAGTPNTSTFQSGSGGVAGSNGINGASHSYSPHSSPPSVVFGSGGVSGNSVLQTPTPVQHRHGSNGRAAASNGASHMHAEASGTPTRHMGSNITDGSESEPPHPPEFYDVLDMVSKGMTPAGVRSDIVDSPPDPTRAPTPPSMPRKPKPWEQSAASTHTPDLQGALRAAAESAMACSSMSDHSPYQGQSSADRENGVRWRQQASESASVGQGTPAA